MAAKEIVESAIKDHKIVIFSKTWCPYCGAAKGLFNLSFPDEDVEIIELDEKDEGPDIQAYLLEKTGQRTVPSIFINQKHMGGNDAVQDLNQKGELAALVKV
ncbi:putative grx1-glutaredoxin [Moniliophthora roreri MCA 2997]|uniref:Grx1-glutaredoxin n=2 Tax=Moniliophthora roreri TaxID=221103 RepID=V2XHT9_MONRO|nr:putative grx1-glutaredoxin [Moniliophthora roreri MCA 2997]